MSGGGAGAPLNVLLLGGGGREHALAWAISRSPRLGRLAAAPGNAGIGALCECLPLDTTDPASVLRAARMMRADVVVIGPEAPLVAGVADALAAAGIPAFGPSAAAARLEGSKADAKRFMTKHGVPTAGFRIFDAAADARGWLESREARYPLVVKADGLAAGKGVVICPDRAAAAGAVSEMMDTRIFGAAGDRIVIEDCLVGREASFFVLCDGARAVALDTCQDFKRLEDGDRGPNTGGMGGLSPNPWADAAVRDDVLRRMVQPTLAGLAAEGRPFRGVLFLGLMLTGDGPRLLEYNVRFGDPETQTLLPRLASDLLPLLHGAASGALPAEPPRWRGEASVCVVLAAPGYPTAPRLGAPIAGLDTPLPPDVFVFHAGTKRDASGAVVTAGGRVLAVVALGRSFADARARVYDAALPITFEGRRARTDIAQSVPVPAGPPA